MGVKQANQLATPPLGLKFLARTLVRRGISDFSGQSWKGLNSTRVSNISCELCILECLITLTVQIITHRTRI